MSLRKVSSHILLYIYDSEFREGGWGEREDEETAVLGFDGDKHQFVCKLKLQRSAVMCYIVNYVSV